MSNYDLVLNLKRKKNEKPRVFKKMGCDLSWKRWTRENSKYDQLIKAINQIYGYSNADLKFCNKIVWFLQMMKRCNFTLKIVDFDDWKNRV